MPTPALDSLAFVHDYLAAPGGAEKTLAAMVRLYPAAPVYTLLYDRACAGEPFTPERVIPSFLQRLPKFLRARPKLLAPLLPVAVESFDLRDHAVVVSSSSAFAKGVIVRAHAVHVCYCHTPMRFAWDWAHAYGRDPVSGQGLGVAARLVQHYVRVWDRASSDRVHYNIANSRTTAERIAAYWRRSSTVIYPPVDVDALTPTRADDGYFLVLSRLAPYKRIDLAVEAFNKLQLPLVVAGDGPERGRLEALAGPTISFRGAVSEAEKRELLERCTALIFPGEDDFGIVPVEAMAAGKPVLAFRAGGACETVVEGVTGEFFTWPVPQALADGVRRVREALPTYARAAIRARAEEFRRERFEREFSSFLDAAVQRGIE